MIATYRTREQFLDAICIYKIPNEDFMLDILINTAINKIVLKTDGILVYKNSCTIQEPKNKFIATLWITNLKEER